jgi:hypothetical protein
MAMLIASTAILTEVGAGRSESWAPHDIRSGQAHRAVVRCTDWAARRAALAFPSARRFLTVGTCLRATVEKFRPHPSHLGSALVPTEWPAHRETMKGCRTSRCRGHSGC